MDYFPPTFPGLSPARRGPQLTALVVVGMAILVALGVVAFPFVARGTALASLPPSGGNLVPSADPTPTPTVIGERADDLEVRTLPLLTTEARQAWQLDDLTAVEQAGQALFGAEWSQFRQASDRHAAGWGMSGGAYDLGEPGRLAKRALAGLSPPDEPRVLDLIGLLIAQTGPLSDGDMAAALALGESAASHFKSCDSLLTRAHLWSLVYRGVGMLVHEDLTTRWLGIEPFEAAVAACGSDPTAAIEQFKYLTGNRGCAAVGPAYHSWYAYEIVFREADAQPILGAINQLGVDWPDVAAAQVAIGDAYAMLAQCVGHPDWRLLGPFTAREFLGRAEAAYRQAMSRSTVPTIVAGLLKVRAELGRDLETPVNNRLFGQAVMDTPAVLQALATSYALSGDFDQAFYYERTARDLPPAPAQPIVEYDRGDVTLIPGTRGVLIEYPYGQGGASATVQSFGFVPQSRLSAPDYGPAFEQFLYLSESHRDYVHGGVGQLAIWCGRIDWDSPLCQAFQTEPGGPLADDQLDFLQDLWRYWGQFAVAATLGDQWAELRPGSGLARERLAEIRFLTRDWNRAAEAAKQAVANYPGGDRPYEYFDEGLASSTGPGWAQLVAAAAERMAGQPRAAQVLLTEVVDLQLGFDYDGMTGNEWVAGYQANLESFLYLELGQAAYELRDYPRAISQFLESVEARAQTANVGGVAEQGLSLSYLATNQPDKALEWAQVALAWDPYSPLYAEAVADAKRALSEQVGLPDTPQARAEMMAAYREALALNPSLFSAWNNLGVLLAQAGQTEEAIEAFHQALAARKNYPLAWFNLGVTEASQGGVAAFLRSQGALGQAGLLNRELKDRDPIWAFDNEVYASGLDVSKPIPADWQLSGTIRTTSTGITIGLIIIIALRLGWALGSDWLTGRWREGALRRWQGRPGGLARIVAWRPHPAITTVISAGALLWLGGANGVGEWVLCALVVAAILSLHAFTPHLTSRLPVRHTSYPPGSLMTLIGLPFGVGFAPPAPLVGTGVNGLGVVSSRIVARVGVATVGLLAVLFALGAGLTGVPTARTATTLALILAGSALTPIPPLDGSTVKLNRGADLAVTIVMIAATILFTLQLL